MERRQSPRWDKKVGIKFKLFDAANKTIVTNAVNATTENLSREGMCLVLPRGWDCPECNNCLGWFYNCRCQLRNGHTRESNHIPKAKLHLKIIIPKIIFDTSSPLELDGECVWLIQSIQPQRDDYKVGITLSPSGKPDENQHLALYQNAMSHMSV